MDFFHYKNGELHAENVALAQLAEEIGTPFYCYSAQTLRHHYQVFSQSVGEKAKICFAVKSNSNLAVLKILAAEGCGADVVSEGEIRLALAAGIAPENIVFSGVGKTKREMEFALEQNIFQFNLESLPELEALSATAQKLGKEARIVFRVNPDVDAGTHAKISTGKKENKFGVSMEDAPNYYARAAQLPNIRVQGISVHIGSQLTSLEPFRHAFERVKKLALSLRAAGHKIDVLDLGGGLGIPYKHGQLPPSPAEYGQIVQETMGDMDCSLVFEPGRLIAGNAGVLVTKVIYIKQASNDDKKFVIVDAAMNDLIRPSLYDAWHDIVPVKEMPTSSYEIADVVGPVCETGDTFAADRDVPPVQADDLLVFRSAGAYGAVMGSTYNARPLAPEILVDGDKYAVVRKRASYEEMLAVYNLPDWL